MFLVIVYMLCREQLEVLEDKPPAIHTHCLKEHPRFLRSGHSQTNRFTHSLFPLFPFPRSPRRLVGDLLLESRFLRLVPLLVLLDAA